MGFLSEKPVTAVTTTIDRLTSDQYSEDDLSDIVDLIEIIHIKAAGPTEAARAIRKKLKYGNRHSQLRALTLLDLLVQNGDKKLGPLYDDEMLLDRLRATCLDPLVDQKVKRKIQTLATVWNNQFADTRGMEGLATLIRQVPSLSGQTQVRQRRVSGSERNDFGDNFGTSSSGGGNRSRATSNAKPSSRTHSRTNSASLPSSKPAQPPRSSRRRGTGTSQGTSSQFDIIKEKPKLTTTIAEANTAATNLNNALQHINREQELSTENQRAIDCFEKCKKLRRLILRYIQVVESEEYIGSLIHANEELVAALKLYEKMSKPLGEESDSDFIDDRTRRLNISDSESDYVTSDEETEQAVPPKASNPDDPFDDSHVVHEPSHLERPHY